MLEIQTGVEGMRIMRNASSWLGLQTTQEPHTLYITLSGTEQWLAASILENGSALLQQPDAFSEYRRVTVQDPPRLISVPRALANSNETSLRVYSTGDSPDVYEDSFMAIAKPDGETFHPTLVLVGTRLGIDKINQVYWEALTATLQMPQSVGIAGYVPRPQLALLCRGARPMLTITIVAVLLRHTTS